MNMMQNKKVFNLLNGWAKSYLQSNNYDMQIRFNEDIPMGNGTTNEDIHNITIGIHPVKLNGLSKYQQIEDNQFVKIGITMFHELSHHEQKTNDNIPKEIILSDLSKYGNLQYYKKNWYQMPHEIDAEYGGVMQMWSKLKGEFPDKADRLMLDHLTYRAENTLYMINMPEEGFTSREQIDTLFDQAYDRSLSERFEEDVCYRKLPSGFLRSDDEVAKLLTNNDRTPRLEYVHIYQQLITPNTGSHMDTMMSSLVSIIHPELQEKYPAIDFDELNPAKVFGIPVLETTDEIRKRLNLHDDFTNAVNSLPTDTTLPML